MKEKTYKKIKPYGYILLDEHRYWLLAPHPMVKDDWQRDDQQRWAVAVMDCSVHLNIAGKPVYGYNAMNLVISTAACGIFLSPDLDEIYVWDGEYAEVELEKVFSIPSYEQAGPEYFTDEDE